MIDPPNKPSTHYLRIDLKIGGQTTEVSIADQFVTHPLVMGFAIQLLLQEAMIKGMIPTVEFKVDSRLVPAEEAMPKNP